MDKFHFEIPTIDRKDQLLDYLQEHVKTKSKMDGTGGLNRCLNKMTYEEWLSDVINCMDKKYAEEKKCVPTTTFLTIRESDDKIIGMVNFRHYLNDELYKYGGHIGYGIRPSERNKGYSKIQLFLALLEAQKMGLDKVMIDCVNTNEASEKTIKALGGVFDGEEYEEKKNRTLKVYWIDVNKSLEINYEEYSKYLKINSKLK